MLVLRRKVGQEIAIGDDIIITVVEVSGNEVRLGFLAPKDIQIIRTELLSRRDPKDFNR